MTERLNVSDVLRTMKVIEETAPPERVYVYALPNQYDAYCQWFGAENVRPIPLTVREP